MLRFLLDFHMILEVGELFCLERVSVDLCETDYPENFVAYLYDTEI